MLVVMFYSVFGEILTLMCLYCLSRLSTTLLIVQSPIPPQGVFNALIFKGKSVRFQQRMKGLFAKFAFFKVLLKVQCSKLFICILSSQAFELGWIGGGGGRGTRGRVGEILRVWEMKLIIRTRRAICF